MGHRVTARGLEALLRSAYRAIIAEAAVTLLLTLLSGEAAAAVLNWSEHLQTVGRTGPCSAA